jgi:hypothetical protein
MLQEGKLQEEDMGKVPDIYITNQDLDNKLKEFRRTTERMKNTHE